MKKSITLLTAVLFLTLSVTAQRVAIVDINTILESVPDYKEAQRKLDQTAEKWKQEIAQEYGIIEDMYRKYQAEQVLLSESARKQREDEIIEKEKQVRALQNTRFGPEGELFLKRQELVKPVQDKVYSAIEEYAEQRGFDLVLDKSSSTTILFSKAEMDKTNDILQKLGITKN